jgi:APA family basic amino acid/polyamine antiporter
MTELKRSIKWPQLMLYGIGSMLGAGIYGLVGRAAGVMGGAVWVAFLVAMVAALLTAISYASIASRYPKAGGAAYVSYRAYRKPWLSYVVGLMVLCSGLASIATQSKVVAENLNSLIGLEWTWTVLGTPGHTFVLAIGFILVVAGIVFRGITESLWANALCTAMEVSGLLLVIVTGVSYWGSTDLLAVPPGEDGISAFTLALVMQGAVLTFFSFLGFEDMLNVAEEVENPNRTMPIAVIGAMLIASAIYISVAITAVSVVPPEELAEAPAPLKHVIEISAPWFPAIGFVFITIAAVANTALVNFVMGSRLLYGMSRQGLLPEAVGKVHGKRQTPHVAILIILTIVLLLQLAGNIEQLASATVLLLLTVFTLVNGALVVLQRREGRHEGCFNVPMAIPVLGAAICLVMIVARISDGDARAPMIAAGLIVGIAVLYLVTARGRAEAVAKFAEEH